MSYTTQNSLPMSGVTDYLPSSKTEWKKVGVAALVVGVLFSYVIAKGATKRAVKKVKASYKSASKKISGVFG